MWTTSCTWQKDRYDQPLDQGRNEISMRAKQMKPQQWGGKVGGDQRLVPRFQSAKVSASRRGEAPHFTFHLCVQLSELSGGNRARVNVTQKAPERGEQLFDFAKGERRKYRGRRSVMGSCLGKQKGGSGGRRNGVEPLHNQPWVAFSYFVLHSVPLQSIAERRASFDLECDSMWAKLGCGLLCGLCVQVDVQGGQSPCCCWVLLDVVDQVDEFNRVEREPRVWFGLVTSPTFWVCV